MMLLLIFFFPHNFSNQTLTRARPDRISFMDLPLEIVLMIFGMLTAEDRLQLETVCKLFRRCCQYYWTTYEVVQRTFRTDMMKDAVNVKHIVILPSGIPYCHGWNCARNAVLKKTLRRIIRAVRLGYLRKLDTLEVRGCTFSKQNIITILNGIPRVRFIGGPSYFKDAMEEKWAVDVVHRYCGQINFGYGIVDNVPSRLLKYPYRVLIDPRPTGRRKVVPLFNWNVCE